MARQRETPLTREQSRRAARFAPLAFRLAGEATREAPGWIDAEALRSDFALALVRSARRYRPGRLTFPRYLRRRLDGVAADAARREARRRRGRVEMPDGLEDDSGPVGREIEEADAFEILLVELPGRHAAAMRLIYRDGETHREAGQSLGLKPSRVGVIHREALAALRSAGGYAMLSRSENTRTNQFQEIGSSEHERDRIPGLHDRF